MARLFDDAAVEYLEINSAVYSSYPVTLAAWFMTDDATVNQNVLSVVDSARNDKYVRILIRPQVAGDPVSAQARFSAASGTADSTAAHSTGVWHHVCGVFPDSESRSAFLDGGNKGTESTSVTFPTDTDRTNIGYLNRGLDPTQPFSGRIAHAAVWNAALTNDEVAALYANGRALSPLLVRPQNLVAYWPLFESDGDRDWFGHFDLTAVNTPSYADQPPIVMSSSIGSFNAGGAEPPPPPSGPPLGSLALMGMGR